MNKRHLFVLVLWVFSMFLFSCSGGSGGSDDSNGGGDDGGADAVTPVYVTFYAHNEDTWQNHVADEESYLAYRNNLLEKLHLLADYGATLNWQSDIVVLEGMIDYEQGAMLGSTGGKNIVRYMVEDLGFAVDPHGHLRMCNYADLAYLVEQLGAPTPEVIGGCRVFEFGNDYLGFLSIIDWREEIEMGPDGVIRGRLYPDYEWTPKILSVPALAGHWFDDFSSGLWRPGQGTDYYTDDPGGDIVCVGQGYPHGRENLGERQASGALVYQEDAQYVQELVAKIESGELPGDRMYTASIHLRDQPVVRDAGSEVDTLEGLEDILEDLKPLYDAGKIEYITYQDAVALWQSEYGGRPYRVPFEGFTMVADVTAQAGSRGAEDSTGTDTGFLPSEVRAYDADTLEADTRIACGACGEDGVFVRLHFPATPGDTRYTDTGSPVVVSVQGGLDNSPVVGEGKSNKYFTTGLGLTAVYFNLPGSGVAPYDTGGTYDHRGAACREALGEVLRFSLGKKADLAGRYITDIIPYADLENVGVIGLSNGGNLAVATLDRYGDDLDGISYYVGYENPAADEYVLTDLGGVGVANPAYQRGGTVLDPVKGSLSTLDATHFLYDAGLLMAYFDLNENGVYDAGADYGCNYWEAGGVRYYSTEVVTLLAGGGLISFPHPLIAGPAATISFWDGRDMSLHTAGVISKIDSLKGCIIVGTEEDHVQFVPGYPHIVVNYQGWSGLPFVRLNPDAAYAEHLFIFNGMDSTGVALTDNPAGASVDFYNVDTMLEPEKPDKNYNVAAILEMADRVHYDEWAADLTEILR